MPWSKAANDDGTFRKDDGLLETLYATQVSIGTRTRSPIAASVSARSHTWFVLKELLGQTNVKNYDGSWTEYGSLVGVPVALGDEPGEA